MKKTISLERITLDENGCGRYEIRFTLGRRSESHRVKSACARSSAFETSSSLLQLRKR